MVDQLRSFAAEVTRVAKEVGTEGRLGGQANVEGVSGTVEGPDRQREHAGRQPHHAGAQHRGGDHRGRDGRSFEEDHRQRQGRDPSAQEHDQHDGRPALVSCGRSNARRPRGGHEGKLGGQAKVKGVSRTWKDLTDNVNTLADNLTNQVRNIADVTTAVAKGEVSSKITVDARGEILELKNTINTMVDQLSTFAAEVTRVAREVGTEGKLGVQAQVEGRLGCVEGPHRQREPARRHADDAAARDLRGLSGGDAGRPHALDRGGSPRRGRRAEGHDQPDDREPGRDHSQ